MAMKALILTSVLATASYGVLANHDPMINEDLFEGDILGIPADAGRSAIPQDAMRWSNGVIPYVIDPPLAEHTPLIKRAMDHIQSRSCITFVPKTGEHKDYINMTLTPGCSSFWGRLGRGEQRVSLGNGCHFLGTVVHELFHAIGFIHEQNRPDRDDYLTINYENIPEKWHYAFRKLQPFETRLLTPFDYDSVMLYGEKAFTKDYRLKTIEAKDGRRLLEPYSKPGMSAGDIKRVNMLYNCKLN